MKLLGVALVVLIVVGGMACGQGGGAKPAEQKAAVRGKAESGRAEAAGQAARSEELPGPTIPKNARFTVYCVTIKGADHAARAKGLRGQLQKNTGMRDWYIIQGEGQSTLYYGFYRDEKEGKAQEDRKAVANLRAANGDRLFQMVCLMPLEGGDPTGDPQWNLENAKGMYTLQIAVYRDSPQRKDVAVQAVKEARAAGVEAYYYHGPNASIVCVGAWPETAVRETAEVKALDPNEVVGIAPSAVDVPENMMTSDGRRVRMVKPTFQILDPTLLEAKKKFPAQSINGLEARRMKNPQTGAVRTVVDASVVVKIPQKGSSPAMPTGGDLGPNVTVAEPNAGKATAPAKVAKPAAPVQQGGKLKSLED